MKFAAVVPAAGLSSRMGSFKPLLDLNGKPLICRTLDSLRAGGAERIVVVTGHRAEELEAAVAAPDICFVRNQDYAHTGMFESVKIGLSELGIAGREAQNDRDEMTIAAHSSPFFSYYIFILPGDIPLVSPGTMQSLKTAASNGAAIVRPSYQGKAGHPVLLSSSAAQELLQYKGPEGLRGFLKDHLSETVFVEADDPAILMDADTPEDYMTLYSLREAAQ